MSFTLKHQHQLAYWSFRLHFTMSSIRPGLLKMNPIHITQLLRAQQCDKWLIKLFETTTCAKKQKCVAQVRLKCQNQIGNSLPSRICGVNYVHCVLIVFGALHSFYNRKSKLDNRSVNLHLFMSVAYLCMGAVRSILITQTYTYWYFTSRFDKRAIPADSGENGTQRLSRSPAKLASLIKHGGVI